MKKVILSLLCLMSLMAATQTVALADESQYKKLSLSTKDKKYKSLDLPKDTAKSFSQRLTWSTNMVEWLIFAPNVGVEIDLKDPTLISCPSLFFQFSYRPGKEDFIKNEHFNTNALAYWRARAEYRWHFRMNERREQRKGLARTGNWFNEQFMTKKVEMQVPDTAAINAGNAGATMYIMSKEPRIQEKIDSTMKSTLERRTELFPGRYYLGVYGEYMDYTFNNNMIPIFGESMKDGVAYSLGLSGGYDFPGFNYNHKCFLQWSVGASLGLLWFQYDEYNSLCTRDANNKVVPAESGVNKVLPFITELKVALNFRNSTISKKYWQPDKKVYEDNLRRNHDDSIHMAELDTVLAEHPVIINVTSVNGVDSDYVEVIDKIAIVNAFRQTTGLTYLMPNDFNMLQSTNEGLKKKELSDNYYIEYTTTNRLRNYEDSTFINDRKNLPFVLQISGREEADSLKKNFIDSLTRYYEVNNSRPVFYGIPATRDSLKGYISKDSIAAGFSRIWGHKLDTAWITKLYTAYNFTEDDGSFTTYYDSVITEQQINRKDRYGIKIQFHPQVSLSADDYTVARFTVGLTGADNAHDQFMKVGTFINNMAKAGMGKIRVQRSWNGKDDTYDRPVTKEEIMTILSNYGMEDIDESVVYVTDTARHFHASVDTINFYFGVTEDSLQYFYDVSDSVGLAQNRIQYNDTIRPWVAENYYNPRNGLYEDNPLVPGYLDTVTGEWYVNPDKFLAAVKDITFTELKPYLIDSIVWKVQPNPWKTGQFAGKYMARALMNVHREQLKPDGSMFQYFIPYLIEPVESMEAAGWVPPVVEAPVDSTAQATRDSIVYVLDSVGNILDSTIVKVPVLTAQATRDSIVYVLDSVGNILDSTIVKVPALLPDSLNADGTALQSSTHAVTPAAEEVEKIVTVAEATAASKEAAAYAKQMAAESKRAAAEAKKAKSDAAKLAKTSAKAIEKARTLTADIADSTVITTDSMTYLKDSLGVIVDSVVVSVEHKIANELDSAQMALILERDSIIAANEEAVIKANQNAYSLQVKAEEAAVKATEAKSAAAEAKKAIAEAKKAEKAAKAEAKRRAKEEAAAAKVVAKAEAEKAKSSKKAEKVADQAAATVEESAQAANQQAEAVANSADNTIKATEAQAAEARTQVQDAAADAQAEVQKAADTTATAVVNEAQQAADNAADALTQAQQALKDAQAESKQAAVDAKAAAAALKKAQKDAKTAVKAAADAQKKVPVLSEFDEPSPAVLEARQLADSLQQIADQSQSVIDSLQSAVDLSKQRITASKAAIVEAKQALAEAKKAQKAAAAEAKKRAKEEAAAAKAAAKAAAAEKKAAEAEAKRIAKEEAAAAKAAAKAAAAEAKAAAKAAEEEAKAQAENAESSNDAEQSPAAESDSAAAESEGASSESETNNTEATEGKE